MKAIEENRKNLKRRRSLVSPHLTVSDAAFPNIRLLLYLFVPVRNTH